MDSTTSLQRPPNPHKITSQFLPRSLQVSSKTSAFRNCRVKGFYLKKLLTYSQEEDNFDYLDFESVSQAFRNKKSHKILRHAEVCSGLKQYVHYCLKTSSNLQTFALKVYGDKTQTNTIPFALRKLPAKIKHVCLLVNQDTPVNKKDIYDIARSIRRFPKLQSFQREFIEYTTENKGSYIQKELAIYTRSVARLREIKRMSYCISQRGYYGLQRAMRRGCVYKGITGLELSFWQDQNLDDLGAILDVNNEYLFLDFENMTSNEHAVYKRIKDEIKEKDKIASDDIEWSIKILPHKKDEEDFGDNGKINLGEERIDSQFIALCRIREEARHFYRFELFPDLKELSLTFKNFQYYFGSFVVDGFCALKRLENLKITIREKSNGTCYIFRAFLKLPLLKKFSFSVNDLNSEEWGYFGHFVERQKKIEEFHFGIMEASPRRTYYLQQNASLKRTVQYLGNNFSLKSLHFDLRFISLEALSQGLSHMQMINQLHTFKFKACDDILTSQKPPMKRVEGLCQFLKNQKGSLRTLHVDLPLALEDTLITHIAETISQLNYLKELSFQCNYNFRSNQAFDYYQNTLQQKISPELQEKLARPEQWNPSLAKYLKKLSNLEKFIFNFDVTSTGNTDPAEWFVDVVSILTGFEKLSTLEIVAIFANGSLRKEKPALAHKFLCLSRIKNIVVELYDLGDILEPKEQNLEKVIEEINQRKARKNDYLFY